MDRLDPTEIDRSGWGERINLQVDMPGLFCTHQGIQYEIDKIIGRDYLKTELTYESHQSIYNIAFGHQDFCMHAPEFV